MKERLPLFDNIRRKFCRLFSSKEKFPAIVLEQNGFSLAGIMSVRWDEVIRVLAYKADLLTTDEIIVELEHQGPEGNLETVRLSEEYPGFADFMTALGRTFPSIPSDWYVRIMQPAFATNFTELYSAPLSTKAENSV